MTDLAVSAPTALEDMSAEEGARLIALEQTIERGIRFAVKVAGPALLEIHDLRLFRASHPSFEAYCLDRHDISRSTANRMLKTAREGIEASPTHAISAASARAAQKRHETLDQPPATIEPPHEPMERRSPPDEPHRGPSEPPKPEKAEVTDVLPSRGPRVGYPPGAARTAKMQARLNLNRVLTVLDNGDQDAMAEAATQGERRRIGEFAALCASKSPRPLNNDEVADPKTCDHPTTRRIGTGCGKCGATKVGKS